MDRQIEFRIEIVKTAGNPKMDLTMGGSSRGMLTALVMAIDEATKSATTTPRARIMMLARVAQAVDQLVVKAIDMYASTQGEEADNATE